MVGVRGSIPLVPTIETSGFFGFSPDRAWSFHHCRPLLRLGVPRGVFGAPFPQNSYFPKLQADVAGCVGYNLWPNRLFPFCRTSIGIMAHTDDVFRCPVTGRPLRRRGDTYVTDDEATSYRVHDDIAVLLPQANEPTTHSNIIEWYDSFGWTQNASGGFNETDAVNGAKQAQIEHTGHCISRLSKYFEKGGDYIVDVGSGPIAHPELLRYGQNFEKRICIDLSLTGLQQAKQKLGDRGIYVQGDATKLPLASGSIDAITCNHLIYQLPVDLQRPAILELWRVLKPGGVAVIVYRWLHSGFSFKLEKLASKFGVGEQGSSQPVQVPERDPDEPQPRSWFEGQDWPFAYSYDCYRLIDNEFMRRYVSDDWRGRLFLNTLLSLQRWLPSQCGRYGQFPAIIIHKPAQN